MNSRGRTQRPRGRPKSPATTELMAAQIAKQDAMARRTVRKINAFLNQHIQAGEAAYVWAKMCRVTRSRFAQFVEEAPEKIGVSNPAAFRRVLARYIDEALVDLDRDPLRFGPVPDEPPPPEPRARACRSTSLAEARAQNARLQARLIDVRERVTVDAPTNSTPSREYLRTCETP
jgi:hypothetical protein